MILIPEDICLILHEYIKLPLSLKVTNKNIKDSFIASKNLKMILYSKINKNTFIDKYNLDLRKLYLLIKKYNIYQEKFKTNEPISSILIDLLSTESKLPCTYSSHSIFTNDIFDDLKEIIRIVPQSLKSETGVLRCRYYLSPLDMACNNLNIPLSVIEYMIDKQADMYHFYEFNGQKIHILDDIDSVVKAREDLEWSNSYPWLIRYIKLKNLFEKKNFDFKKKDHNLSILHKKYKKMYE